jgi:hypothetical protein
LDVLAVAEAVDHEEVVNAMLVVVGRMRFQSNCCEAPVGLTARLRNDRARELDTGRRLNMVTLRMRMKRC